MKLLWWRRSGEYFKELTRRAIEKAEEKAEERELVKALRERIMGIVGESGYPVSEYEFKPGTANLTPDAAIRHLGRLTHAVKTRDERLKIISEALKDYEPFGMEYQGLR